MVLRHDEEHIEIERKSLIGKNKTAKVSLSSVTGLHLKKANALVNGLLFLEVDGRRSAAGFTELIEDPHTFAFRVGKSADAVYSLAERLESIATDNRNRLGIERTEITGGMAERAAQRIAIRRENAGLRPDIVAAASHIPGDNREFRSNLAKIQSRTVDGELTHRIEVVKFEGGRGWAVVTDRRFFVFRDDLKGSADVEFPRSLPITTHWKSKTGGRFEIYCNGQAIKLDVLTAENCRALAEALRD
ncbi:PH domain-containing protein [Arthrobacter tecti]